MNYDSIVQKVSLPSCPHSTEQIKRVYISDNQQHKHIQSLFQKFVNHRILSFFITVYSILQTSDYIFMLISSTQRTFLFVLSIIRYCLLNSVTNSNHKRD
mgnify:FL=1